MKIFTPKMNKRGALQLSINAIVVLILAITMLGLGLGFIRGMFGSTIEQFQALAGQLEEEDRKTLEISSDEISFLTSKIKMAGREKTVYFAVRNNRASCKKFQIKDSFECYDAIGSEAKANAATWILFDTYEDREIMETTSSVMPLTITASPSTKGTIYSCRMKIPLPDDCEDVEACDPATETCPEETGDPDTGKPYKTYNFEIEYTK